MLVISIIRQLLSLYALLLLVDLVLPYVTTAQQPWMAVLARICEPAIQVGNQVAAKLIPERRTKVNVGVITAIVLCYVARLVLGLFA